MSATDAITVTLRDEEAMKALGAAIAIELCKGDVVVLVGELGAGKTTLVKGIVGALDPSIEVTSPTFALCHRYEGTPSIAHVDCWRIKSVVELEELALDELLDEGWIALIEWGDRLGGMYDEIALRIDLVADRADRASRSARLSSKSARWNAPLDRVVVQCERFGESPC